MRKQNAMIICVMMCLTSACSRAGADTQYGDNQSAVTVNGQDPVAYFNFFISTHDDGKCELGMGVNHFLSSSSILVGKNPAGQDIRADINIYMHPDHTYVANYEEHDVEKYLDMGPGATGYNYSVERKKRISGTWGVDRDHLELSNLAEGSALEYNKYPAVALRYTNDVISAGLSGASSIGTKSMADFNEDGNYDCAK